MTIAPSPSINVILPTGTAVGPWSTGFTYSDPGDVRVLLETNGDGAPLVEGTDYVLTGTDPRQNGGDVTLLAGALPSGGWTNAHRLIIVRRTQRRQGLALPDAEGHKPRATERSLDHVMRIAQEDRDDLDRAVMAPLGEAGLELPPRAVRAGRSRVVGSGPDGELRMLDGSQFKGDPGGTTDLIGTLQAARQMTIGPEFEAVRMTGYSTPGDGGGALYRRAWSEPSHAGKFQSLDGQWWELAEEYFTPDAFGVFDDPLLSVDQSARIQAWLAGCVLAGRSPYCPRPLTVRVDAPVIYDPTGASIKPRWADMENLTLRAGPSGGIRFGSPTARIMQMTLRLPQVRRRGTITWLEDTAESRLSNDAGVIIYNAGKCNIHLGEVYGFTLGAVYHSENFGFAYNNVFSGWLESNRYNEVGRTVRGSLSAGEFFNENTFHGGSRRENSDVNAFGNAYGTVITAGAGAYRGNNKNVWFSPTYEMGDTPTATYRVPVFLDGAGYQNSWERCRHESGRGPFGIAKAHPDNIAAGTYNSAHVTYQSGNAAEWRSGWLQVAGAYANLHHSPLTETHSWSTGPLRGVLSSGGSAGAPRIAPPVFLARSTDSTPRRQGGTAGDLVTNTRALQLGGGVGLLVEIDTTNLKDWRIALAALQGFGGRLFVACFDQYGGRLVGKITDSWGKEAYAKFFHTQSEVALFGGGYLTPTDNTAGDLVITFRPEVKKAWVGFCSGSRPLAINAFDLVAYSVKRSPDVGTAESSAAIALTVPTADEANVRLSSANPGLSGQHGKYQRGEFIGNALAAAGAPIGWMCAASGWLAAPWAAETAYAVPGHCVLNDAGKIYALREPGVSGSAGGPTGEEPSINDGSCVWEYVGGAARFLIAGTAA